MLIVSSKTERHIEAVKQKCKELDKEYETDLVNRFDNLLKYISEFGDHELEGMSLNHIKPHVPWDGKEELTTDHFNFSAQMYRPNSEKAWSSITAIYRNGGPPSMLDPITIEIPDGPGWTFHS